LDAHTANPVRAVAVGNNKIGRDYFISADFIDNALFK
jgi:hypothetical protein